MLDQENLKYRNNRMKGLEQKLSIEDIEGPYKGLSKSGG
jgi:hypothetical protein